MMLFRKKHFFSLISFGIILFLASQTAWSVDISGVMPAALDQPHTNLLLKTSPTGDPIKDTWGLGYFAIDAYLDTGASGVMLSEETALEILGLQSKLARYPDGTGPLVVYQDVGVGGTQDFNVTTPLYLGLAKFHPDVDGSTTTPFNQTVGPVRLQINPLPANEAIGPLDVVGMPAMVGKVVVMDPKPVDTFMDSMRTYIYNPGTPFNSAAVDTEPGIPTTNHHIQLSYASFDQFTTVAPAGAPGPTMAANPFIGPNPITGASANTPGVTVSFDGLKATGSFLFDSGAGASMISTATANKLHVRYREGTFGTANPILERLDPATSQWVQIADQFTSSIGGVGGDIVTAAGFFLDDMLVRTKEGNAANDLDPNHLNFRGAPVLVNDISLRDPITNQVLTLDGIFGMNNLVANAMVVPGYPVPSIFNRTLGNFNWVVFDQSNGILGLDVKPPISYWNGNGSSEINVFLYGAADINWSNSVNWEGVSPGPNTTLVFSKSNPTTTNNFNDFPDNMSFNGITFNGSAAFTLQGNRIALTGDVLNNSSQTQTIDLDIVLSGGPRTFAANTGNIVVNGILSGDQGLVKTGGAKLILKSSNSYAGDTTISEGTLTLDGGDLPNSPTISIASGAALEVLSGTPSLRTIVGQGTVSVLGNGTVLTADSITADTLTIGGSTAASVPEPSTFLLLLAGLAGMIFHRRNR